MKQIEKIAFFLFLIGFVLKFIHAPYHTVIMLVGLALLLGTYTYFAFSKKKSNEDVIADFTAVSWMIFLLFVIKFFPFNFIPLTIATIMTLFWLLKKSKPLKWNTISIINLILIILSLSIYLTPLSSRYQIFNIRFNKEIKTDFQTWDKYSWFLYQDRKFVESTEANIKAQKALGTFQLEYPNEDLNEWKHNILQHKAGIQTKTWTSYQ